MQHVLTHLRCKLDVTDKNAGNVWWDMANVSKLLPAIIRNIVLFQITILRGAASFHVKLKIILKFFFFLPASVYTDTVHKPVSDLPPARTEWLKMERREEQVMHGARKQIGLNIPVNLASAEECSRDKKHVVDCKIFREPSEERKWKASRCCLPKK